MSPPSKPHPSIISPQTEPSVTVTTYQTMPQCHLPSDCALVFPYFRLHTSVIPNHDMPRITSQSIHQCHFLPDCIDVSSPQAIPWSHLSLDSIAASPSQGHHRHIQKFHNLWSPFTSCDPLPEWQGKMRCYFSDGRGCWSDHWPFSLQQDLGDLT